VLSKYNELQDKWLNNQLIGLDVIIAKSGVVTPIDIEYMENDSLTHTFGKEYSISYGNNSTLEAFFDNYDEPWSEIQVNDQILINNDCFILCGEGEMGSEGFIVKTDINNNITWMLYSTTSNPFINIKTTGDIVYVQSSANFYVAVNSINDSVSIVNENIQNRLKQS
jgi:hypothetical protein